MKERIIRLPQVRELVGLGRTAIYGKIKAGDLPKLVKLGRVRGRSCEAFGVQLVWWDGELQPARDER